MHPLDAGAVLLIGGNGFIGSHVVDSLRGTSQKIIVYDRFPERFRPPQPGVEYITGDLSQEERIAAALEGVSCVIHLASATVPSTAQKDPHSDVTGNLLPTLRLMELLVERGVGKLVYLSSGGTVYGIPNTEIVHEDHPLQPIGSYGIVKVAIENYMRMMAREKGLTCIALRPSNPYGSRLGNAGLQGVIGTYLWNLARNRPLQVWGDGSVCRDYLHVRDLAQLCRLAVGHPQSDTFNAGSSKGHSVLDILAAVRRVTGIEPEIEYLPARGYDIPRIVLDCKKAEKYLGWKARTDMDTGIAETWSWVCSQGADSVGQSS